MTEKACRNCHLITTTNVCPVCKTTNVTDNWTGVVVVLDPENSQIAEVMGITKPGRYALRVR